MGPKRGNLRVPHRREPRAQRTMNMFGQPLPDQPEIVPIDPNTRVLDALADPESSLPERNAAVIIARAALKPRPIPPNPELVRPVIERRPILSYKIEEEEDDAKVNQFFVAAFANISKDISKIAHQFFGRHYHQGGESEQAFFEGITPLLTPMLRGYISFLAEGDVGGYHGEDGWKTIFRNGQEREYLFRGILHKWIEENVFDKLLFGASKEQEGLYTVQEKTHISHNGYVRTRLRSETTIAVLTDIDRPPNFSQHVKKLARTLTKELHPIHAILRPHYQQDYRGYGDIDKTDPANPVVKTKLMKGRPSPPSNFGRSRVLQASLEHLIAYAASVHVACRRSRNIIHIVPAFRGTPFTPEDHTTDADGTAYYNSIKYNIEKSDTYNAERKDPSSFPPGIYEGENPPSSTTFPIATQLLSPPSDNNPGGDDRGTYLQYVPFQYKNSVPALTSVGIGIVGTYLAYTFDVDLPFGEDLWRGFAALPGGNVVRGAAAGSAMGFVTSIPFSSAVAVAGSAAGFLMGSVMGVISEQGQIYYWNWTPDPNFREASWAIKKSLYSAALAGALAAGVVRWVKNGIVVPENSRAFYPQDNVFPLAIGVTSVGVPLLAEITAHLVKLSGTALAAHVSPYLPVSPDTIESWWPALRDLLVPLISSGSAAYLSTASDWNWLQLIASTALGMAGGSFAENFASDFNSSVLARGYMLTLPRSLVAAMIATAAATSMRYRHEVTRPRITDIPPPKNPHYRCMTRIAVTPAVRLYKPGDGSNRRDAQLNGQRVYEVQKATILCHWGIENFGYYEGRTKISLDHFLSRYTSEITIPSMSPFSTIGSVFKTSTAGYGENLILFPGPLETAAQRWERLEAERERERLLVEQAERERAQQQAQQQQQGQQRPAGPWNFGARIRRDGIRATAAAAHVIGNGFRVTKNYAGALCPIKVRKPLLTLGALILLGTGALYAGPKVWDSVPNMPQFPDVGGAIGNVASWGSDKIRNNPIASIISEGLHKGLSHITSIPEPSDDKPVPLSTMTTSSTSTQEIPGISDHPKPSDPVAPSTSYSDIPSTFTSRRPSTCTSRRPSTSTSRSTTTVPEVPGHPKPSEPTTTMTETRTKTTTATIRLHTTTEKGTTSTTRTVTHIIPPKGPTISDRPGETPTPEEELRNKIEVERQRLQDLADEAQRIKDDIAKNEKDLKNVLPGPPPDEKKKAQAKYDLSILHWVGYRGADNAIPGDNPPPRRGRKNILKRKRPSVIRDDVSSVPNDDNRKAGDSSTTTVYSTQTEIEATQETRAEESWWQWPWGRTKADDEGLLHKVGYRGEDNAIPDYEPAPTHSVERRTGKKRKIV